MSLGGVSGASDPVVAHTPVVVNHDTWSSCPADDSMTTVLDVNTDPKIGFRRVKETLTSHGPPARGYKCRTGGVEITVKNIYVNSARLIPYVLNLRFLCSGGPRSVSVVHGYTTDVVENVATMTVVSRYFSTSETFF